jgi:NADH:ubiquinone oxidoreductase subunit 3 (subunit A)
MDKFLLSPPFAFAVFLALGAAIYRLGGIINASGPSTKEKHQPYTGGEAPLPPPRDLGYHAFFRLALLFGILHVATLVLSTLPRRGFSYRAALAYLAGIAISVFVLTGKEE